MKRAFAVAAAVVLLPVVVLLAAAVGVLGGSTDAVIPVAGGGAAGLAVAAAQAGFTGQGLRLAVAVGLAESGGNPTARNPNPPTPGCPGGSLDRGGWQLNTCYHTEVSDACADDLACAAEQTYRISAAGSDWSAWTTYTSGAYRAQLGAADQAIAILATPSVDGGEIPSGFGTPGPCGLSPATDYTKHLVTALFGITDIGGCALFTGHVPGSDHYPDANGQAHAIDVMTGADIALGWQVATWAAANAAPLQVKYVIFAGQIIDFREPTPAWHACRDPASSCATEHFDHVHISATQFDQTLQSRMSSPSSPWEAPLLSSYHINGITVHHGDYRDALAHDLLFSSTTRWGCSSSTHSARHPGLARSRGSLPVTSGHTSRGKP